MALLDEVGLALDDDDISGRLGMNRHYVNQICRRLSAEGKVTREPGTSGKLLNRLAAGDATAPPGLTRRREIPAKKRLPRDERARRNVANLISGFDRYLAQFERSNAFPGPSLYFHHRALARRQAHTSAASLMDDELFFEYVYAVLLAWGMHRMGKQAAKVGEFDDLIDSFRSALPKIEALWSLRIVGLPEDDVDAVAEGVWDVIADLKVSTSRTRIVAGTKALHHVLPELVPPIDRQYTFRFFTGQKSVSRGDRQAFLEWFPLLTEIGRARATEIQSAVARGGFMATGPAKVIDNAIMGFIQSTET